MANENPKKSRQILLVFVFALILGGIFVFFAVAGRTNQIIEEKKAQKKNSSVQELPEAAPMDEQAPAGSETVAPQQELEVPQPSSEDAD